MTGADASSEPAVVARSDDRRALRIAVVVTTLVLFGVMFRALGAWILAYGRTAEVEEVLFEPERSSPLVIYSVFVLLMYGRRRAIREIVATGAGDLVLALPLLAGSVAAAGWSTYVGQPPLLAYAFSLACLGAAAALGGRPLVRCIRLPALFSLLAVPLPGVLVNAVIYPLQRVTAELTCWLLGSLGFETAVRGVQFVALGRGFRVIESCAGLRSMLTALMASIVYVDVMVADRRRGWYLVPAAVSIAFVMNIARVLTIVAVPSQELADEHSVQGLVAIVATILALAGLDRVTSRAPSTRAPEQATGGALKIGPSGAGSPRWVALACAAAVGATTVAATPVWRPPQRVRPYLDLPTELEGFTGRNLKVDREFLGAVDFDERIYRLYERDGDAVEVFVALDQRLDPAQSVLSPKVALLAGAAGVVERRPLEGRPEASELRVVTPEGQKLIWTWTEGAESFMVELARALLALDRGPWRRDADVIVVRAATPIEGSIDAARSRLARFVPGFLAQLTVAPATAE